MKNLQKIMMLSLICLSNMYAQEVKSEVVQNKQATLEEFKKKQCQECKQLLIDLAILNGELNYKNADKATEIDQNEEFFQQCVQVFNSDAALLYEETADHVKSAQLNQDKKELLARSFQERANQERIKNGMQNQEDIAIAQKVLSIQYAQKYVAELLEHNPYTAEETQKFLKTMVPSTKKTLLDSLKDAASRASLDQRSFLIETRNYTRMIPSKKKLEKVFDGIIAYEVR